MECPFKKRKIEENDSDQATSIAVIDELITNSNENMPESLNEQNELEIVEEDEEAGNSGEDLFNFKVLID